MQYPMHYHQHMGYPITYHQRIAIPIHFIHSGTLFHIQFFNHQHIKNLTSPTPAKNCCQVLPTPLEDAQMPSLSGFSDFCPAYLSSPKEAFRTAEAAVLGASAMFGSAFQGIWGCFSGIRLSPAMLSCSGCPTVHQGKSRPCGLHPYRQMSCAG